MKTNLYDPKNGEPAVTARQIVWSARPEEPQRTNCFSVYWFDSAAGAIEIDLTEYAFVPGTLAFLSPYRRIRVAPARPGKGTVIEFHANFLCVETFHAESGCSGVLFNDPFGSPIVRVPASRRSEVRALVRLPDVVRHALIPCDDARSVGAGRMVLKDIIMTGAAHTRSEAHTVAHDARPLRAV